jgi:hypothetical protein
MSAKYPVSKTALAGKLQDFENQASGIPEA